MNDEEIMAIFIARAVGLTIILNVETVVKHIIEMTFILE
jgi:hypothetical protein